MSFASGYLGDPKQVGAGERFGTNQVILTSRDFEDGLKVGRFAKLDTGSIDNMDGSSTPTIAGVVLRNVANATEDALTVDSDLYSQAEYAREGMVTVAVKDGETPTQFGIVYASNAGDADDGLATATDTDIETAAEFIEEVQSGIWLIRLK